MELPGHHVWGGRGRAWAGAASPKPQPANTADASAAICRFMSDLSIGWSPQRAPDTLRNSCVGPAVALSQHLIRSRRDRLLLVSEDRVRVRIADNGVATATMVRADKHNALDQAMFEGLVEAAEQLAGDASVRAVVLHGEGKSFCSGLDVASFMGGERGTGVLLARDGDRPANLAQRVTYDWSLVPAPVIAAIHGNCFGGGLQIALGADIRIAAPDAKLSIMEIKWGLVPDMGITQTLPRLLPIDVA